MTTAVMYLSALPTMLMTDCVLRFSVLRTLIIRRIRFSTARTSAAITRTLMMEVTFRLIPLKVPTNDSKTPVTRPMPTNAAQRIAKTTSFTANPLLLNFFIVFPPCYKIVS